MSCDSDSFLQLCKELRELGAQTVEGYGFKAVFLPAPQRPTVCQPPNKQELDKQEILRRGLSPKGEAELRELQRAHELGLV